MLMLPKHCLASSLILPGGKDIGVAGIYFPLLLLHRQTNVKESLMLAVWYARAADRPDMGTAAHPFFGKTGIFLS